MAENQEIRKRLLEAGIELLEGGAGVSALTPAAVAAAAGLLEADFTASHPHRLHYLTALMQALLDELRVAANHATDRLPHDMTRLKRGIDVYLDQGVRRPWLRELILELQPHAEALQMHRNRVKGWMFFFQIELSALNIALPLARAQLCISMASSIAFAEYEARGIQPEMRQTLYAYMDHLLP